MPDVGRDHFDPQNIGDLGKTELSQVAHHQNLAIASAKLIEQDLDREPC